MAIVKDLLKALGQDIVITGDEAVRPFECDGLSVYRQKPLAVVLVENIKQIKTVLKLCRKHCTPIVTRGAGTGLSGGALPLKNSVVLGLSKLNKILDIDPKSHCATVQAGVSNIAISQAVSQYDLYYAPDPSSQIACSIGGNVAENSGGVHCLKYGLTVHNVIAVKMLTIDGREVFFHQDDKGVGWLALMNGSEGMLGIVVEVVVKLLPKPESVQLIMAGFNSVDACANAVSNIIKQGVIPAGLEMMDEFAISAAKDFTKADYPTDAKALLLCELDGNKTRVQTEVEIVLAVLEQASSVYVARSEAERLALWKGRKSAFPAIGRLSPDYYCMDGTLPKRFLAKVLKEINTLSQQYGLRVANVFHAGDGNLHPLILYDANQTGQLKKAEAFGSDILKLCVDLGGTITGEHGVGIEKLDEMCYQFSDAELSIFHQIKHLFDSNHLFNPGKVVPTLHRCAELGKMHVHHGQLPHPELERF